VSRRRRDPATLEAVCAGLLAVLLFLLYLLTPVA
jgi:hypothetical protein